LLDAFVEMTGYARKYAIHVLNQAPNEVGTLLRPRQPVYGPEVQQALFLAWRTARYICAKRLIPFLPTLVPFLERHGHLQISEEQRHHLLSMSSATAERVLRTQRKPSPYGISATKAGTLLKQQIPIRTFAGWDNARPGFLEADLVAHCGGNAAGSYLYTLTLTDVATGWTECLPLRARASELVVKALERARTLFPFPILGIDTDNGSEFINDDLVAYCEREHLTFTRGRPEQKNDQCFVEERNRAVVRRMVGYDRLVGEQAYHQLGELYRALHLYVNCFQPSMKLLFKQREDDRTRLVYDPAKTPLQRLLLSDALPALQQEELGKIAQALDPLRLVEQVEQLQGAVWCCAIPSSFVHAKPFSTSLLRFSVEPCLSECFLTTGEERETVHTSGPTCSPFKACAPFLNWQRSSTNPFASEWEQIAIWVHTYPDRSVRDLLEELQRQFPGRYTFSHYPALQRGVRKIRTALRKQEEESWPVEIIHGPLLDFPPSEFTEHKSQQQGKPVQSPTLSFLMCSVQEAADVQSCQDQGSIDEEPLYTLSATISADEHLAPMYPEEHQQIVAPSSLEVRNDGFVVLTMELTVLSFLQERRAEGRASKTIEWHQTALRSLSQFLTQQEKRFLQELSTAVIRDWLAHLLAEPSETGILRSASTIQNYARSARAFCHWLVQQGYLARTPFVKGTVPKAGHHPVQIIEPEEFEHLLQACGPFGELMDHATARNRALLWLFLETGLLVSEVCGLHLWDVDREQGQVRVQGPDAKERQVPLGASGLHHLLCYLDQSRLIETGATTGGGALFLSERRQPLTPNAITLLFQRLSQRAEMTGKGISPSLLRDSFAVRYLQQGGHPKTLQKLLGLTDRAALKRYQDAARSFPHQMPAQNMPDDVFS
jgi:site-specific recombinase XerD